MTIPKEIIAKAVEGGWDGLQVFIQEAKPQNNIWQIVALDPKFWQALGKALRWGSFYDEEGMQRAYGGIQGWYPDTITDSGKDEQMWQYWALTFYDLILTGGDTEKFWSNLLTTNK